MTIQITICDMRAAGKPGYVAKIEGTRKDFLSNRKADSFTTSAKNVHYEISEDGIYEVCDANFGSRKRNIYFIQVENGEITRQEETLLALQISDVELPDLEGSSKQISWAASIREKFIAKMKAAEKDIPDWVYVRKDSKFWIDNRDKF